jgi:hypothetical protein
MAESGKELAEWYIEFIKHKDIFQNKILRIDQKDDTVSVEYKDRNHKAKAIPDINSSTDIISILGDEDSDIAIITLNKKSNLDGLIKSWETICRYKKLTIFFVNTKSKQETKWMIRPYVHNMICDHDSLKNGLKSMFDTVDLVRN